MEAVFTRGLAICCSIIKHALACEDEPPTDDEVCALQDLETAAAEFVSRSSAGQFKTSDVFNAIKEATMCALEAAVSLKFRDADKAPSLQLVNTTLAFSLVATLTYQDRALSQQFGDYAKPFLRPAACSSMMLERAFQSISGLVEGHRPSKPIRGHLTDSTDPSSCVLSSLSIALGGCERLFAAWQPTGFDGIAVLKPAIKMLNRAMERYEVERNAAVERALGDVRALADTVLHWVGRNKGWLDEHTDGQLNSQLLLLIRRMHFCEFSLLGVWSNQVPVSVAERRSSELHSLIMSLLRTAPPGTAAAFCDEFGLLMRRSCREFKEEILLVKFHQEAAKWSAATELGLLSFLAKTSGQFITVHAAIICNRQGDLSGGYSTRSPDNMLLDYFYVVQMLVNAGRRKQDSRASGFVGNPIYWLPALIAVQHCNNSFEDASNAFRRPLRTDPDDEDAILSAMDDVDEYASHDWLSTGRFGLMTHLLTLVSLTHELSKDSWLPVRLRDSMRLGLQQLYCHLVAALQAVVPLLENGQLQKSLPPNMVSECVTSATVVSSGLVYLEQDKVGAEEAVLLRLCGIPAACSIAEAASRMLSGRLEMKHQPLLQSIQRGSEYLEASLASGKTPASTTKHDIEKVVSLGQRTARLVYIRVNRGEGQQSKASWQAIKGATTKGLSSSVAEADRAMAELLEEEAGAAKKQTAKSKAKKKSKVKRKAKKQQNAAAIADSVASHPAASATESVAGTSKHEALAAQPTKSVLRPLQAIQKLAAADQKPVASSVQLTATASRPASDDQKPVAAVQMPTAAASLSTKAASRPAAVMQNPVIPFQSPMAAAKQLTAFTTQPIKPASQAAAADKNASRSIPKTNAAAQRLTASTAKPTKAASQTAIADEKPSKTVQNPTTITKQSIQAASRPAAVIPKPVATVQKLVAAAQMPTASTTQPTKATSQHAVAFQKPMAASRKSVATPQKSVTTSQKPAAAVQKHTAATTRPLLVIPQPRAEKATAATKKLAAIQKPATAVQKPVSPAQKPVVTVQKLVEAIQKPAAAVPRNPALSHSLASLQPPSPTTPRPEPAEEGDPRQPSKDGKGTPASTGVKVLSTLLPLPIPLTPPPPPPPWAVCSITKTLLKDPVIAADGATYERAAIKMYFSKFGAVSPVDGTVMEHTRLLPNRAVLIVLHRFRPDSGNR